MTARSCTYGVGECHLVHITIPDLLDQRAEEYPDQEVYVLWTSQSGGLVRESISYGDLAESSYNIASSFLNLGLHPCDRLAVVSDDCLELLLLEYACLRCKLLLVPIPPSRVTAKTLMEQVVKYKCKSLIVDGRKADEITQFVCDMFLPVIGHSDSKTQTIRIIGMKRESGSKLTTVLDLAETRGCRSKVKRIQDSIDPDDTAVVLNEEDERNELKFVEFSHFALINNSRSLESALIGDNRTIYYDCRSFCGSRSGIYTTLAFGITMIHVNKRSQDDLDHMSVVFSEENVTCAKLTVRLLERIRRASRAVLPDSLRCILTENLRLQGDLLPFYQKQGKSIIDLYVTAQTLLTAVQFCSVSSGGLDLRAIPHVELKVTNHNGVLLPAGQPGCLWVKSLFEFRGRLETNTPSDRRSSSGWCVTGDVATMNRDGGVAIVDRCDHVIRHGSLNIYPAVVELKLRRIPSVEDVVVIGVPDGATKQDVIACIKVTSDSTVTVDYLLQVCEQLQADGEIDCRIKDVALVDEFPTTAEGELSRTELINMIQEG